MSENSDASGRDVSPLDIIDLDETIRKQWPRLPSKTRDTLLAAMRSLFREIIDMAQGTRPAKLGWEELDEEHWIIPYNALLMTVIVKHGPTCPVLLVVEACYMH